MALPELIANSTTPGTVAFITKLSAELKTGVTGAKALKVESAAPTSLRGAGQAHLIIDKEIIVVDTGTTNTTEWTILERKAEESTEANHLIASNVYNLITRQTLINAIEERAKAGALQGWINVTEAPYSATGNGVTDDTSKIQSAIDALPAGGGVLFLPSGKTFAVTSLKPKAGMTIIGYGATLLQKSTATTFIFKTEIAEASKFACYGLRLVGESTNSEAGGFYLIGLNEAIVADCYGQQLNGGFISAQGNQKVIIRHNIVKKCVATGTNNVIDVGQEVGSNPALLARECIIEGNITSECGACSLAVATLQKTRTIPTRVVIANNVVENSGSFACIACESGGGEAGQKGKIDAVVIANNICKATGKCSGIWVTWNGAAPAEEAVDNYYTITGNTVETAKGTGILLYAGRSVIANNTITISEGEAEHAHPITVPTHSPQSNDLSIEGNVIFLPTTFGTEDACFFQKAERIKFANNQITYAEGNTHNSTCLWFNTISHLEVLGNQFYNVPRTPIYTTLCKNIRIKDNRIWNCGQVTRKANAIEVEKSEGTVNLIADNLIVDDRVTSLMEHGITTAAAVTKEILINNVIHKPLGTALSGTFQVFTEYEAKVFNKAATT